VSHEKLPDGKYNFLLQGLMRARIVRELPVDKPYRVADLAGLVETTPSDSDLAPYRQRLQRLLQHEHSATVDCVAQFEQLLQGSLPLGDVLDVITFTCLDNVALKQSLLAEPDVLRRVARVVEELEQMSRQSQDRQMAAQRASLN
jgi:Lon protease-like protein